MIPNRREAIRLYCLLIKNRLKSPIRKTMINITEVHHIIPRCVCKWKALSESKYNLIRLYAHEHFLAHYYLSIIFKHNVGVQRAFYLMGNIKGMKKYKHIDRFCKAYEHARATVIKNKKNKSYNEIYGKTTAEKIKIKQKKSKLDYMVRFFVDK